MTKYLYKYLSSIPKHGNMIFIYPSNLETHEEVEEEIKIKLGFSPLMLEERSIRDEKVS